jgi:hypothetical protein
MAKQVFVVFSCNRYHDKQSYELIGVASTVNNAIKMISVIEPLTKDDISNLRNIHQTQLSERGNLEFAIIEKTMNVYE